jgi:hypothetical protein
MSNVHFYSGEICGSTGDWFDCYIEANSSCEAENKLLSYYENNLMPELGEMTSINIIDIEPEVYFKNKKTNEYVFI